MFRRRWPRCCCRGLRVAPDTATELAGVRHTKDRCGPCDEFGRFKAVLYVTSPKMTREALYAASCNNHLAPNVLMRLQELVDECDRNRPLGADGKHGNRHTETCGCDESTVA